LITYQYNLPNLQGGLVAYDVVIKQVEPTAEESETVNLSDYAVFIIHFRKLRNEKITHVADFACATLGKDACNWSLVRKFVSPRLRSSIGTDCNYANMTSRPFDFRLHIKKDGLDKSVDALRSALARHKLVLLQGK
jgi:hypothetical protein